MFEKESKHEQEGLRFCTDFSQAIHKEILMQIFSITGCFTKVPRWPAGLALNYH